MSFYEYNSGIYNNCKEYLDTWNNVWQAWIPRFLRTIEYAGYNFYDLDITQENRLTYYWCVGYIHQHKHLRGGNYSKKRQSKRKQNRGKKSK